MLSIFGTTLPTNVFIGVATESLPAPIASGRALWLLDFFTFPLSSGDPKSLEGVNNIILTDAMAKKYFGDTDPIGRQLMVKFTERSSKSFTVTGVAEKLPKTRAVTFNFLMNLENYQYFDQSFDFSGQAWGSLQDRSSGHGLWNILPKETAVYPLALK